jgi:hypothetical protein
MDKESAISPYRGIFPSRSIGESEVPNRERPAQSGAMTAAEAGAAAVFDFVPKDLTVKCRQLIDRYHGVRGYGCLPDMLWDIELRGLIAAHKALRESFHKSSTTRSATKANEGFVAIASLILALEIVASDYAGWGRRFPSAKLKADEFRRAHMLTSRTPLIDRYLYPRQYIDPALANLLTPPENPAG